MKKIEAHLGHPSLVVTLSGYIQPFEDAFDRDGKLDEFSSWCGRDRRNVMEFLVARRS